MTNSYKKAIITGATSGIGLCIAKSLCEDGIQVIGIGRDISKVSYSSPLLTLISCDLSDDKALTALCEKLKDDHNDADILIHSAGVAYYGLLEDISAKASSEIIRTNLEAPVQITRSLMRSFKKNGGSIIFISSVTAEHSSPHAAVYGATKAALSHYAESVFDEARKFNVNVSVLHPDMTETDLYRNADFETSDEEGCYLTPEDIKEAVRFCLDRRPGSLVTKMSISPSKNRIKRKN